MTPDSGRRTPRMSAPECERVASQRCPSGSRCWNLRKSQSPSTAGHLVVTARSRTQDHRWIRAKRDDPGLGEGAGAVDVDLAHVVLGEVPVGCHDDARVRTGPDSVEADAGAGVVDGG